MIGYLSGSAIIRDDPYLIIDVNGVGYKTHAASDVLSSISIGSNLKLFIYTHVREDVLELYGFSKYSDLKLFELIITVPGVGPRTAIAIFSNGTGDEITKAIIDADVTFFSGIPRLGTKNAQKIIIELKNKVGGRELDLAGVSNGERNELVSALKAFGFTTKEINEAIRNTDRATSVEEQIKAALKYLGK
ncbi:MAG: Holliday junction DNA helicase RuvA [Candidatus Levybacteria bacterium RIFCSPHIGHO2_02_FULL_40_18]|nr:MAG: Holliday junction DNA helicase RuvA [Candidatus Levybacteria bacterium RIFCSPHIGHO2_01_FULL_40_58]OGH26202.1 MAG: Holliday junction DNA helicase RuvA [Candidatus Levybacteria bacterium RIFCSPHIGHO2_02_FULL_40_18]OGH31454.1 MAG: Holliday junction DNA helicase RuvA [Candidatus Levybacteria bacterium RIFCSPHIGHO2_12_FULL_40_31]OGH40094.1 MAG: Holliday junction DNA helicase RuvA [Candidatus Levybacteria bacterium RIFCSPLOWO2_01_FULL_40_64]OGH49048.1 MAG: Holliday junction DNA helicase RuvA 